jgi:hypothetical protein
MDKGLLADSLSDASTLHSEPQWTEQERNQLITLLDQLAGSVIYSREHHLEQAYIVQQGDSWDSIGARYQVPGAFLARVNGLPEEVPPPVTQPLKVVRGPFRAEMSLEHRELTLFLGPYYAGRFNVGVGRDLPPDVQVLMVAEKGGARPFVDATTGQMIPAGAPESPYGQHWIGLVDESGASRPALAVHSVGPAIEASDTRGCITVSDRDADDLKAILSRGSKVAVLR